MSQPSLGKVGTMSTQGAITDPTGDDETGEASPRGADDAVIVAAADGSALGNPGPAGWAWYVDEGSWQAGGWPHGTNNMGELKAVLALLQATADRPNRPLRILCDSKYVINCITQWMPGWKAKGWKKKDGKPVLNRDLLEELDRALAGRTYEFEWVKGHAGHHLNEAADERARAAATAFQNGQDPETGPGFVPGAGGAGDEPAGADDASTEAGDHPSRPQEKSAQAAVEHEKLLSDRETWADAQRLAPLLAEDLVWVTAKGRLADKTAAINYPEQAFALDGDPDLVRSHAVSDDTGLVVSNVRTARGPAVRSSLWTRTTHGAWALAMRQDTLEL